MADECVSGLVHGPSKTGKTTLSSTLPGFKLLIDMENGTKYLPGLPNPNKGGKPLTKTTWKNFKQPPPKNDNDYDLCIAQVRQWQDMVDIYKWLPNNNHDFNSISIDSITQLQMICKDNLVGDEQMKIQSWGFLLSEMDKLIKKFRDLPLRSEPIEAVLFIAESQEVASTGKQVPTMQGQIRSKLPYMVDFTGYIQLVPVEDENGQMNKKAVKMLVAQHDKYEAGNRFQGRIPDVITSPNITEIMHAVYPKGDV